MAQWHLDELRAALERRGWRFAREMPGDDYRISGSWAFERSGAGPREIIIDFHGLDDMITLPMDEAYACYIRASRESLYFRRRVNRNPTARARWSKELAAFVDSLDGHAN